MSILLKDPKGPEQRADLFVAKGDLSTCPENPSGKEQARGSRSRERITPVHENLRELHLDEGIQRRESCPWALPKPRTKRFQPSLEGRVREINVQKMAIQKT